MYHDQNRYSFSGSDVAAFAFYPHLVHVTEADHLQLKALKAQLSEMEDAVATALGSEAEVSIRTPDEGEVTSGGAAGEDYTRRAVDLEWVKGEIARIQEKIRAGSPVHLESLATCSISIHEPKAPVRALGHRGTKGFARSVRTIAGTMILLVIEDHPLRALAYQAQSKFNPSDSSFSLDLDSLGQGGYRQPGTLTTYPGSTRLSTLLKPFNMILRYRSEVLPSRRVRINAADPNEVLEDFRNDHPAGTDYFTDTEIGNKVKEAQGRRAAARQARRDHKNDPYGGVNSVEFKVPKVATMMIEGIEIISEGITTSVNDMVTEVVIQFVAQDVKQLSTMHESSILSYAPDELPPEVYDQLRGQALEISKDVNEDILGEMRTREKQLRKNLGEARAIRRRARQKNAEAARTTVRYYSDKSGPGGGGGFEGL